MLDQGTYLTGKSLNAEVDCLLKVNSGQIYIIECKTYPSQVATTRRAVLLAAASAHGFSRIEAALDQVRIAVGQDKVRAQFEATHTITRAGASVEDVDRAIRLLLGVPSLGTARRRHRYFSTAWPRCSARCRPGSPLRIRAGWEQR